MAINSGFTSLSVPMIAIGHDIESKDANIKN